MVIVISGVAGSGKTTIGQALAQALGWRFNDADEFHPVANIAKMAAGHPLNDADRAPWLQAIREHIERCLASNVNAVVTCSALKQIYRDALLPGAPNTSVADVKFVFLHGSRELLAQRIGQRSGHFMKPEMLASQLAALEEPSHALRVDIAQTPEEIVGKIRQTLGV